MAIVLTESFDTYTTLTQRGWTSNIASVSALAARTGANGLRLGGSQVASQSLPNSITYIAGFAHRITVYSGAGFLQVASFNDAATVQVDLRIQYSAGGQGTMEVTRNGTVLLTSTYQYPVNVFHYIELEVTVDPVTGAVIVRVDQNVVISGTNLNTRATANTQINAFEFYGQNGPVDFDDLVILDKTGAAPNNDFLGDVGVYALVPAASGTYTQYTPSPNVPNWQNVDEIPPDDNTSYNHDLTSGHKDTFIFQTLALSPSATVFAVNVLVRAEKDDSGARTLKILARQPAGAGGVDFLNANVINLGTPYQTFSNGINLYPLAPDGTGWTVAKVNNVEYGYQTP